MARKRMGAEHQELLSQDLKESDRLVGLIQYAKSETCLSILVGHFTSWGKSGTGIIYKYNVW